MRWEYVASLGVGLGIGALIVMRPSPALVCLGLLSLLLGLMAASTLKIVTVPALVAILGGIALIGLGRLVGLIEALVRQFREANRLAVDRGASVDNAASGSPALRPTAAKTDHRVEPHL